MEKDNQQLMKLSKAELIEMIRRYEEEKDSETISQCKDILRMGML